MKPLLQITTIPIAYQLKVQRAQVERRHGSAEIEISREKGRGFQIQSQPSKVRIDTFDARNSMIPSTPTSIQQAAAKGKQAAADITAQWASENHIMMKAKIGEDATGKIVEQNFMNNLKTGEFALRFIPEAPPNIQWTKPDISSRYEMDRLRFNLKVNNGDFQYIPGDVSLEITQMPDVNIEYIGGPMYVPPSADPNYERVDIQV